MELNQLQFTAACQATTAQQTGMRQLKCFERTGEIQVIFTVDIFNEGVRYPFCEYRKCSCGQQSPTWFSSVRPGLRKYQDKHYLTVIDFIGNYKRSSLCYPLIFAGGKPMDLTKTGCACNPEEYNMPEGCMINFDFRIIDSLQELAARDPQKLQDA